MDLKRGEQSGLGSYNKMQNNEHYNWMQYRNFVNKQVKSSMLLKSFLKEIANVVEKWPHTGGS